MQMRAKETALTGKNAKSRWKEEETMFLLSESRRVEVVKNTEHTHDRNVAPSQKLRIAVPEYIYIYMVACLYWRTPVLYRHAA